MRSSSSGAWGGSPWSYFYEIYEAIPRQGPGARESPERAVRLLAPLTRSQCILDIGCGAGAQTIDLARATEARIVADRPHYRKYPEYFGYVFIVMAPDEHDGHHGPV